MSYSNGYKKMVPDSRLGTPLLPCKILLKNLRANPLLDCEFISCDQSIRVQFKDDRTCFCCCLLCFLSPSFEEFWIREEPGICFVEDCVHVSDSE